ncbi:MAG: hypothetical protein LBL74_04370 [Bacteroidales bacterium]|nr:hypothetical protein [Bacteroidales bacterium]
MYNFYFICQIFNIKILLRRSIGTNTAFALPHHCIDNKQLDKTKIKRCLVRTKGCFIFRKQPFILIEQSNVSPTRTNVSPTRTIMPFIRHLIVLW